MHRKARTFESLKEVPDIPKDEQTQVWTAFYAAAYGITSQTDEKGLQGMYDLVSANLGEPADEAIIRNTLARLQEQQTTQE